MIRNAFFAYLLAVSPALALDWAVPGSVETKFEISPADTVRLPDTAWTPETSPPLYEGAVRKRVLRVGGGGQTTLQLLNPLREAMREAAYSEVFACESLTCGGFDFRFQLDILGEPEMHVDLGDFRYLLMQSDGSSSTDATRISLVVSRDAQAGYIHITELLPANLASVDTSATPPSGSITQGGLITSLESMGHAVLADLEFGSGASDLGEGAFQSLSELANWLNANPTAAIAIVGHTDAVGGLAANTALSKRRAESVLARLADAYGADPSQMQADGAGYLSPVASNLTEQGRSANRRVEVILLSD